MMGNCRLYQVPRTVQLVLVRKVRPALGLPLHREVRVEVTILLLGILDLIYGDVHHLLELWVGVGGQGPRGRLKPLVDVGVVEVDAPERHVYLSGGSTEVIQTSRLLQKIIL